MKKHVLYGTAFAAATMLVAGGALAADKKKPSISVNGYYDALVGGILDESQEKGGKDMAADTSGADVRTDTEIHFNGRATLDTGMKIHARVEMEGQQGGGERIDEYFLSVSGSFGKIILGGTGGAPVKMLAGFSGSWATGVGETLAFDSDDWVGSGAGKGTFYTLQHSRLDTGDANKATYISPKFGGFQIGLTYSPNMVNDDSGSRVNADTGLHDGLEGAVSYSGKFGDVGFGVGAGMTAYQGANKKATGQTCTIDSKVEGGAFSCKLNVNPTDDTSDWLVAGRIDFGGGFRIAVAHKQVTNDNKAQQGQLTDVGVRFITGSNSFSLTGAYGEMDQGGASYSAVMGSYARSLGPGMKAHVNLIRNQSDNGMKGDDKVENSGTALVSGLKVVF